MRSIETHEQLEEWLEENYYFEDGSILKINTEPLVITIGYLIEGNYCAHTKKVMRAFDLFPKNVTRWDITGEMDYIEEIVPLKIDNGIALKFIEPPAFLLMAEAIAIGDAHIVETTFKPWLNLQDVTVKVHLDHIPKPHFWAERLKRLGHDIVFRYFSGEAKLAEQVPYPNYGGYFLQLSNNIKNSKEGILIDNVSMKNSIVTISFKNRDPHLEQVWIDLNKILADMPNAHIFCGNCQFSGEEWKKKQFSG